MKRTCHWCQAPKTTTTTTTEMIEWNSRFVQWKLMLLQKTKKKSLIHTVKRLSSHSCAPQSRPICWTTVFRCDSEPSVNHTLGITFSCVLRFVPYFRSCWRTNQKKNKKKLMRKCLCRWHNRKRRIANFYLCACAHNEKYKTISKFAQNGKVEKCFQSFAALVETHFNLNANQTDDD